MYPSSSIKQAKEINLMTPIPEPFESIIQKIETVASKAGYRVYAVGGFVRDLITGATVDDLDLLVDGPGDNPAVDFGKLLESAGVGAVKAVYKDWGVAHMIIDGEQVQLTMPRLEEYKDSSRNPSRVEHSTIEQDATRRDFTINTLLLDLATREIHDPLKRGMDDLKQDLLVSANPDVDKMLKDDPLRMLRAIRFHTVRDMAMSPELEEGIRRNLDAFDKIKPERIGEELQKMLKAPKNPSAIFRMLSDTGLLRKIIPELEDTKESMETPPGHRNESSFDHIMRVLDNVPPDLVSRMSALLHDIAKSPYTKDKNGNPVRTESQKALENSTGEKIVQTVAHFYAHHEVGSDMARAILQRLQFPKHMVDRITAIVYNHMRPHRLEKLDDYQVRKLIYDLGPMLDQVLILAKADKEGSGHPDYPRKDMLSDLETRIKSTPKEDIFTDLLFDGSEIKQLFNTGSKYTGELGEPDPFGWLKDTLTWERDIQLKRPKITKSEMEHMILQFVKNKYPKVFHRRSK